MLRIGKDGDSDEYNMVKDGQPIPEVYEDAADTEPQGMKLRIFDTNR